MKEIASIIHKQSGDDYSQFPIFLYIGDLVDWSSWNCFSQLVRSRDVFLAGENEFSNARITDDGYQKFIFSS